MSEHGSETNGTERLGQLFQKIENLFNSDVAVSQGEDSRRMVNTPDGDIILSRVKTSAQDAFLITVGEFLYYLSKNGVEYVRVPDIELYLGNSVRVSPLRNSYQDIQPDAKLEVTETMVGMTEWAVNHGGFLNSPFLLKAKFPGGLY